MLGDLTTIAHVKEWLAIGQVTGSGTVTPNPQSDKVVARLITAISATMMAEINRSSLISQDYTDVIDGYDQRSVFLENYPVTAVDAVSISGIDITASPDGIQSGWLLSPWNGYPPGGPQSVDLIGSLFCRGQRNCEIAYTAGYLVAGEKQTIPGSPYVVTTSQTLGMWIADNGVVDTTTGSVLQRVTGAPATGQYAIQAATADGATEPGGYIFNAAQTGHGVAVSYSFVPSTLEQACVDWVAERFRQSRRIGIRSESIGGQQTLSYDVSDIPAYIKKQLNPYRRVLPV